MKNEILFGDCLEIMKNIPDGSIDMILCDLPYGTTACKWDSIIPFEPLWEHYKRVIKENAAIVLTASQPFTTALISSNMKMFKYCWVWSKNQPSGFALANRQPMKSHEDIAVFYNKQPVYNKQPTFSKIKDRKLDKANKRGVAKKGVYGELDNSKHREATLNKIVSPRSVIEFDVQIRSKGTSHPTQKPVALFEYLIKTYTNEGETVLDNCAGSFTTAVACNNLNREWICIEQDPGYCQIGYDRVFPDGPWASKKDVDK